MMKLASTRNIAIACVVVLVACGIEATWTRTYHPGGWGHVQIGGAVEHPAGGVLLFGSLANYGDADNPTDVFLSSYDEDGGLRWERNYDFGVNDLPMWIRGDHAGRVYAWNHGDDDQVIAFDAAEGEVLWQQPGRFYDLVNVGDDLVLARGDRLSRVSVADGVEHWSVPMPARYVEVDAYGNLFVAGLRVEPGSEGADVPFEDIWLAKLNADGEVLWEVVDGAPNSSDRLGGLAVTPDSGVVISAEVQLTADSSAVVTRSYAADGSLRWQNDYMNSAAFDNYPEDVLVDHGGNTFVLSVSVILGSGRWQATNDERVVTKISPTGAVSWRKVEGGFAILNRGLLIHRLYYNDANVYATGDYVTHVYEAGNGSEVATVEDGSYQNNCLAFGGDGEIYLATTKGTDGIVERYERP